MRIEKVQFLKRPKGLQFGSSMFRVWFNSWLKRTDTGCLEWQKLRLPAGYGQVSVGRKMLLAHRVAWMLEHGEIPDELIVMHRCDNPPCCNIAHLAVGSQSDNLQDMVAKGRHPNRIGESNTLAKLTDSQVEEIRQLHATGNYLQREIALMFGVSRGQIHRVVNRIDWSHVK